MLGCGVFELQFCDSVHMHLPINSACFIFHSEVQQGHKKAWKQEAEDAKWQMPGDHIHLSLQVRLDHRIGKRQVITCQTAPTFLTWYYRKPFLSLWLHLCGVWVNSATDVICKEMKQDCHHKKTLLMDYLVITTYFATEPSYFAICCYFLWKKNKQNFIRLTVNYFKFNTCIWSIRKRLLKLYIVLNDDDDCIL